MNKNNRRYLLLIVSGVAMLSFGAGCAQPDPSGTAAPSASPGAKEPAPVKQTPKRIGPLGKGNNDV